MKDLLKNGGLVIRRTGVGELVSAIVIVTTFVIHIGLIAAVIYRRWTDKRRSQKKTPPHTR